MAPSSTITTTNASANAARNVGIRNGSVCPTPPSVVMAPHTTPRIQGWPRPVRLPSSDSASANPMLIPAPTDAAIPTRKAFQLLRVASAAAKDRGQGRHRSVHEARKTGLNDLQHEQPPARSILVRPDARPELLLAQFLRLVFVVRSS